MQVYAHRGFSGLYPENTMLAFEKAVSCGADGIELDVHCSKDGKLVIIHDETLIRTTGKAGTVQDYRLDELIKINAGKTFSNSFGDTPLPSFSEYCAYIRDKDVTTNVEIKTNLWYYNDIEEKILDTIKEFDIEDKILFSSFNWLSCARIKQLAPHIPCGILLEDKAVKNLAPLMHKMGMDYFHPDKMLLDEKTVQQCKEQHVGLNVWTVNDRDSLQQLIAWDVEGVITNHPDFCLEYLHK